MLYLTVRARHWVGNGQLVKKHIILVHDCDSAVVVVFVFFLSSETMLSVQTEIDTHTPGLLHMVIKLNVIECGHSKCHTHTVHRRHLLPVMWGCQILRDLTHADQMTSRIDPH